MPFYPSQIDSSDPEYLVKWYERLDEELDCSSPDEVRVWIEEHCSFREELVALKYLLEERGMDCREWLTLLGYFWCGLETGCIPFSEAAEMIKVMADDPFTVIPELMNAAEKAAFEALPDRITIYRGCGPENKGGMSWSLDREAAMRFPFNRGYWADPPLLLTATIDKKRIAALKLERNEREVLVVNLPEEAWTEQVITEKPPPLP